MNESLNGLKFFIVQFRDENSPDGQNPRTMSVPAFVPDMAAAEQRAMAYIADFPNSPEGRQPQAKDAKLVLHSIVAGGTILT
jgi:hypothetical protein